MSKPTGDPQERAVTKEEIDFNWHFEIQGNTAVFSLEGREVFRYEFNPDNFSTVLYEKTKTEKPYLRVTAEMRPQLFARVREELSKDGQKLTDEQIEEFMPHAILETCQRLQKRGFDQAAVLLRDNLPQAILGVLGNIVQTTLFSGVNKLGDIIQAPDRKFTEKEIKEAIFNPAWERLKPLISLPFTSHGGARNVKHVWTDEERRCLVNNYEQLQPIWLDAKRIAKDAQKSRVKMRNQAWRNEILRAYPELPEDLIERFATPRSEDAKPSNIALIHSARLCVPGVELSTVRLRKEIKTWKFKIKT